jgi:hypothetical protein
MRTNLASSSPHSRNDGKVFARNLQKTNSTEFHETFQAFFRLNSEFRSDD